VRNAEPLDRHASAVHGRRCVLGRLLGKYRQELLAPVAINAIRTPQAAADCLRDPSQGIVAGGVSVAVVVALERVDIAHCKGDSARVPGNFGLQRLQLLLEPEAVAEARQRIGPRRAEQRLAVVQKPGVLVGKRAVRADDTRGRHEARFEVLDVNRLEQAVVRAGANRVDEVALARVSAHEEHVRVRAPIDGA